MYIPFSTFTETKIIGIPFTLVPSSISKEDHDFLLFV